MIGTVSTDRDVFSPQNGVANEEDVNINVKTMIKNVRNMGPSGPSGFNKKIF
jgi:hypothetical protein